MATIKATDKMLGKLAEDGSIEAWPEVDCFGQSYDYDYERMNFTKRQVGRSNFVLIPPTRDSDDLKFIIDGSKIDPAMFTEPPAEDLPPTGKSKPKG